MTRTTAPDGVRQVVFTMATARGQARHIRSYTIAKYVAFVGLGVGALLIFGPVVSPALGHWLLSMGAISGVTAERMAWGPIALFGTLIPGSIAILVGLISLAIAVVLRVLAHSRETNAT
jgi:hypothetical protein